jgi:hypothetical protein
MVAISAGSGILHSIVNKETMRITHYHCRSVYEDGSVLSKDYPFTEGQASAIGAVGISYAAAKRLVDGWNREAGRHKPRRYYYSLRVEDRIALLHHIGQELK